MSLVEVDLNELAEATAVVVARGLGVAERLHDRIGGEHLLLHLRLLGRRAAHVGEVAHGVLGAHRFAGARLARDDDRLVELELHHLLEGLLGNGEYVRVHVLHVAPVVRLDHLVAVDGQLLVRIDGDEHDATVCVDLVAVEEAHLQVVQHFWFI